MSGSSFAGAFFGSLLGNGKIVRWLTFRSLMVIGGAALLVATWWQRQPWTVRAVVVTVVLSLAVILINRRVQRRMRKRSRRPLPVIRPVPRPDLWSQPHFLYRWYDENSGRLLYVGITNDLERRTGEHAKEKPWMRDGVRAEVETFPDRRSALGAEERAIFRENPVYNVVHNYGDRS